MPHLLICESKKLLEEFLNLIFKKFGIGGAIASMNKGDFAIFVDDYRTRGVRKAVFFRNGENWVKQNRVVDVVVSGP